MLKAARISSDEMSHVALCKPVATYRSRASHNTVATSNQRT